MVDLSKVPDVLEHWINIVPAVGLNREWHGAFIAEIRELAQLADEQPAGGEDTDSPDPEGGRGDAGDAASDGETSEAGSEDK